MNGFDLKSHVPVWLFTGFAWIVTLAHVQEVLAVLATAASLVFSIIKILKEFRNGKRG